MSGKAPAPARRRRPAPPGRYALVVSRYHPDLVERLVAGAVGTLRAAGVPRDRVDIVRVPGAFEIPQAADRLAATGRYAALVALGVVLRGGTPHWELVAGEAVRGAGEVARRRGVPVAHGVVVCATRVQAAARAGGRVGNRGAEAAAAALEMAALYRDVLSQEDATPVSPVRRRGGRRRRA